MSLNDHSGFLFILYKTRDYTITASNLSLSISDVPYRRIKSSAVLCLLTWLVLQRCFFFPYILCASSCLLIADWLECLHPWSVGQCILKRTNKQKNRVFVFRCKRILTANVIRTSFQTTALVKILDQLFFIWLNYFYYGL